MRQHSAATFRYAPNGCSHWPGHDSLSVMSSCIALPLMRLHCGTPCCCCHPLAGCPACRASRTPRTARASSTQPCLHPLSRACSHCYSMQGGLTCCRLRPVRERGECMHESERTAAGALAGLARRRFGAVLVGCRWEAAAVRCVVASLARCCVAVASLLGASLLPFRTSGCWPFARAASQPPPAPLTRG